MNGVVEVKRENIISKLVNKSNVHHITPIPEAPAGAIIAFSIEEK